MKTNLKTKCPICKKYVDQRNNKFSHHIGVNAWGNSYGRNAKQICHSTNMSINDSLAVIDSYNRDVDFIKQLINRKEKK